MHNQYISAFMFEIINMSKLYCFKKKFENFLIIKQKNLEKHMYTILIQFFK